jgi:thiamine kinase-like enzyme
MVVACISKKETAMKATAAFDLACVMREAIAHHEERGCRFKDGAVERLIASPEFAALSALMEGEESECPLRAA